MTALPNEPTRGRRVLQGVLQWLLIPALVCVFPLAGALGQEKHSTLVTHDDPPEQIQDTDFAAMMKELLVNGKKSNVRDAKFLFQECFGGGMLKALQTALKDTELNWVGGSASREEQMSWGETSKDEAPDIDGTIKAIRKIIEESQNTIAKVEAPLLAILAKRVTLAGVLRGLITSLDAEVRRLQGQKNQAAHVAALRARIADLTKMAQGRLRIDKPVIDAFNAETQALAKQQAAATVDLAKAQPGLAPTKVQLLQAQQWLVWAMRLKQTRGLLIEGDPLPIWTRALRDELAKDPTDAKLTLLQAITSAAKKTRGSNVVTVVGGGGKTIKLKDPDAASHHAILWAGRTDYRSIFNGIEAIRNTLEQRWKDGGTVSIHVLFGDGKHKVDPKQAPAGFRIPEGDKNNLPEEWKAQEATKETLKKALEEVKKGIGEKEQFLFYASDHGGREIAVKQQARVSRFGGEAVEQLALSVGELAGIREQPDNDATLTVLYDGNIEREAVSVTLNGQPLGSLLHGASATDFTIPEDAMRLRNEIRVHSENPSAITVQGLVFSTGAIGVDSLRDCNHNGAADAVDVLDGASRDRDRDGIPDDCE